MARGLDAMEVSPALVRDSEPRLEVTGLWKSFDGVVVLRDAGFVVEPHEVHALVGENGAGKSTLINVLGGAHQRDAGLIRLDGQPVELRGPHDADSVGIAIVHQEPLVFPDFAVAEHLFIGRQPRRAGTGLIDYATMNRQAQAIFERLGVRIPLDARVGSLSVAELQLIEIAAAMMKEARLLILDEPTSALTPHEVAALLDIIRRLRADGLGVIFVSHRLEEVFAIADRVSVLRDGRMISSAPVGETTMERVVAEMVGRPLGARYARGEREPGRALLQVENLGRSGEFEDVSLTLHEGEILGLAGLVGAGRTQIAEAIVGLASPTAGRILLDGQEIRVRSPEEAIAAGIAYVPEDRARNGIVAQSSVVSNVTMIMLRHVARHGRIVRKLELGVAEAALRPYDVHARSLDQRARELSGGNQQKVVLARVLARDPKVVILDEPTRGVDVGTKEEIHRLIGGLAERGRAIMLISSDLPEVLALSDRIAIVREGRIVAVLPGHGATAEAVIMAAVAGPKQ